MKLLIYLFTYLFVYRGNHINQQGLGRALDQRANGTWLSTA